MKPYVPGLDMVLQILDQDSAFWGTLGVTAKKEKQPENWRWVPGKEIHLLDFFPIAMLDSGL